MQVNGRPGTHNCACRRFAASTDDPSPVGVHFQDDGPLFQDKGFCKGNSLQAVHARAAAVWAGGQEVTSWLRVHICALAMGAKRGL